jgi:hypothetical protein
MRGEILDRPAQRQIVGIALIALIAVGALALLGSLHVVSPAALRSCPPLIADILPNHSEVQ